MDPVFAVSREELHDVQMELKRINHVQQMHTERLRSLEKRQADDAALKSVWNSPFPSVLGGTPQHGPVHMPATELIDDLDDEDTNLLGSLQNLDAEDEPIRRGVASRANSVRFDVSTLPSTNNISGHGTRHSGDFSRPGSGFGGHQMERQYSHKSDGRHSSAGHSVHSMHSGVSGRISSLGLDNASMMGDHDGDSPLEMPEPPPGVHILGAPPSIIRCLLTTNWTSDLVLYAVVCTGSQKSTIEYSLLRELDLTNNIHRELDGTHSISLPVFLVEARVTQSNSRSASPAPRLPSITATFEVTGMDQQESPESREAARVFIGSHTLRLYGADILLSRNLMTLYGSDRDKLSVPFVRPERDAVFRNITTANIVPNKPKLNASAPEFVTAEKSVNGSVHDSKEGGISVPKSLESGSDGMFSPTAASSQPAKTTATTSAASESGGEFDKNLPEPALPPPPPPAPAEKPFGSSEPPKRRDSSSAIRTPWRQTAAALGGDANTPLSGYQPAARPRNMKVLKASKSSGGSSTATTKTGAAYEPAPGAPRSSGPTNTEQTKRKPHLAAEGGPAAISWGGSNSGSSNTSGSIAKRSVSVSTVGLASLGEGRQTSSAIGGHGHQDTTAVGVGGKPPLGSTTTRPGNNPLGSASAFSWIAPTKPKPGGTSE
ncbi:hypothetical protein B0J18DRAFT_194624 [Chaetomium sp. MPI-SDFR-AT-0129]|nr:hypothetical protein B0J18DRAFT_194624 [Chaetomium sp. MPI-SDFR-AT-0129]